MKKNTTPSIPINMLTCRGFCPRLSCSKPANVADAASDAAAKPNSIASTLPNISGLTKCCISNEESIQPMDDPAARITVKHIVAENGAKYPVPKHPIARRTNDMTHAFSIVRGRSIFVSGSAMIGPNKQPVPTMKNSAPSRSLSSPLVNLVPCSANETFKTSEAP
mmetsp:Transcript_8758/g.12862  ORF Transcript_8758/g.12862 Transcript_8758/m.12862 type:complete len:165 (+) Transcript_8758:1038-1532(+)